MYITIYNIENKCVRYRVECDAIQFDGITGALDVKLGPHTWAKFRNIKYIEVRDYYEDFSK